MTLYEEIQARAASDSNFAALLAVRNDSGMADALSSGRAAVAPVSARTLAAWAAPAIRGRLEQARVNAASPAYSIALSALDLLQQSMDETFDTIAYGTLLDALEAAAIVTADERAALALLATVPAPVGAREISEALNNGQ